MAALSLVQLRLGLVQPAVKPRLSLQLRAITHLSSAVRKPTSVGPASPKGSGGARRASHSTYHLMLERRRDLFGCRRHSASWGKSWDTGNRSSEVYAGKGWMRLEMKYTGFQMSEVLIQVIFG
jgi:hypothetical protein